MGISNKEDAEEYLRQNTEFLKQQEERKYKAENAQKEKEERAQRQREYTSAVKAGEKEVKELVSGKKYGINKYFDLQIKEAPIYNLSDKVNLFQNLSEAEDFLQDMAGTAIINEQTGTTAFVNSNQRGKLVSEKAVEKSMKNGFSRAEHYTAAALVGKIFPYAILRESNRDRGQFSNDMDIRRYVANIRLENGDAFAKYTVKSSEANGQRIYSVELENLERYKN